LCSAKISLSSNKQEISYAKVIFPYIENPSPMIQMIAQGIWEIFTYNRITTKNSFTDWFFSEFYSFNSKNSEAIGILKSIVKQINTYRITDEETIIFLLKQRGRVLRHFLSLGDIQILSELIKTPLLNNRDLANKLNVSEVWISRKRKNYLLHRLIVPMFVTDPHYFNLEQIILVCFTSKENSTPFLSLLHNHKNPYIYKVEKIHCKTDEKTFTYLLFVFIPRVHVNKFKKWIQALLYQGILKNYYFFTITHFIHSTNITAYRKKRWMFDGVRDALFLTHFLNSFKEIISYPEEVRKLKYAKTYRSHFRKEEISLVAQMASNFYQSLSVLHKKLQSEGYVISKKRISRLRTNIFRNGLPYLYLNHVSLDTSIIFIIWEPFITKDQFNFYLKYFSYGFPQSDIYFSREGLLAHIEIPSEELNATNFALEKIKEMYDDALLCDIFTPPLIKHSLHDFSKFWDSNKNRWIIEDWMLPLKKKERKTKN